MDFTEWPRRIRWAISRSRTVSNWLPKFMKAASICWLRLAWGEVPEACSPSICCMPPLPKRRSSSRTIGSTARITASCSVVKGMALRPWNMHREILLLASRSTM
ncbi:hypothetical protein D3C81_1769230 [compost metagenome]